MDKSPDAFRTISEVADWLGTPTHVLRFWESRFTQVKPVKRAGGRRYYRPTDMELLGGIKKLLHDDGMTIRGVQKLLREEGVKHVAGLSPALDSAIAAEEDAHDTVDATALPDPKAGAPMIADAPQEEADNVVPLSRTLAEAVDQQGARDGFISARSGQAEQPGPDESAETAPSPDPATPPSNDRQADLLDLSDADSDAAPKEEPAAETAEATAPAKRPKAVDVPPDPEDDDRTFPAITDVVAQLRRFTSSGTRPLPDPTGLQDIHDRLLALKERMAGTKRD
ncbi:MAG: MerR family transcriptional regulator [Paracoccaceae bacterium]